MSRFLDELTEVCKSSYHAKVAVPFLRYVTHADEKALEQVKQLAQPAYWHLLA